MNETVEEGSKKKQKTKRQSRKSHKKRITGKGSKRVRDEAHLLRMCSKRERERAKQKKQEKKKIKNKDKGNNSPFPGHRVSLYVFNLFFFSPDPSVQWPQVRNTLCPVSLCDV
jgi:ATP adenylyltransferase/5',5'''-P-1,P-4-tetraphosphate phosphorylase II